MGNSQPMVNSILDNFWDNTNGWDLKNSHELQGSDLSAAKFIALLCFQIEENHSSRRRTPKNSDKPQQRPSSHFADRMLRNTLIESHPRKLRHKFTAILLSSALVQWCSPGVIVWSRRHFYGFDVWTTMFVLSTQNYCSHCHPSMQNQASPAGCGPFLKCFLTMPMTQGALPLWKRDSQLDNNARTVLLKR